MEYVLFQSVSTDSQIKDNKSIGQKWKQVRPIRLAVSLHDLANHLKEDLLINITIFTIIN